MISLYVVVIIFGIKDAALSHDEYVGMMAELLENGAGGDLDYSFFWAYKFFSSFSSLGISPELMATALGFLILYFSFYYKLTLVEFIVLFILFLPAFFMNLGKPSKEFFVTVFFLVSMHFYTRGNYISAAVFVVVYAVLFRIYYLPLAAFLLYFSILDGRLKILILLSAVFTLLVTGLMYAQNVIDFIGDIQARRDVGYFSSGDVRRTGFYNLYSVADISGILLNYIYAFLKINLPMLFSFQLKDIFLQVYVVLVLFLNLRAIKVYYLAIPLMVNFLVYPIFEPDLGSYLRHIASIYPLYFALYLLWRDNTINFKGDGVDVWRF
tara:strand:+ start:1671 stop:2642 length:972 start_codon:yes stop_codon:yes gene_type:complete